jgi:hypothetical protein
MELNKFLGAFKNRKQILEGIRNKIFKKEHVEAEAAARFAICNECPFMDADGKDCTLKGSQPCCSKCGCSLGLKTRSLSSKCPVGNWDAIMDEDLEDKLNIDQL